MSSLGWIRAKFKQIVVLYQICVDLNISILLELVYAALVVYEAAHRRKLSYGTLRAGVRIVVLHPQVQCENTKY